MEKCRQNSRTCRKSTTIKKKSPKPGGFFYAFIIFLIASYKNGLNSSIGSGSLYKIELKQVEPTSSLQTLKTGTQSLAEGATKFDTEGIQKVCNLINGDVKNISKRVEKLNELSNEYNNFGMISEGNSGEVKFVMIVNSLK